MTPNDEPVKPVPPIEDADRPDERPEPLLEGVLTAEDIAEMEASGLTLGDVIREIEARIAAAKG